LERESSEMYGTIFYFKNDLRKLLLDYGFIQWPMLKDFPLEGYTEYTFDLLNEKTTYFSTTVVEL
jgi:NADH:ubiquinone oxidoreductase subunit C